MENEALQQILSRFDTIDLRLDTIDLRLDTIDKRLASLEEDVEKIADWVPFRTPPLFKQH